MEEKRTKIFYDFEATSVGRDADPISVGLIAVSYANLKYEFKTFYAEFDDFDINKSDDWVRENIKLDFNDKTEDYWKVITEGSVECKGNTDLIKIGLKSWLKQFTVPKFIADFDTIDQPMLVDLITDWKYSKDGVNKVGLPEHLPNVNYYDFYDLHTMLFLCDICPDISRVEFSEIKSKELPTFIKSGNEHNALYDAYLTFLCYQKIINNI